MLRCLSCLLAVALCLTAPVFADDKVELPRSPQPRYVIARVEDNKVIVQVQSPVMVPVTKTVEVEVNGKKETRTITAFEAQNRTEKMTFDVAKVKAHGADGKDIEAKKLAELLKKDTLVLVSGTVDKVEAGYLKLVKEGTVVLVLPRPLPPVMPVPPIGPMPPRPPVPVPPPPQGRPQILPVQPPPRPQG